MSKLKTVSGYNILYPYLCLLPDEEYVGIMLQVRPCPALAEPQERGCPDGRRAATKH